MNEKIKEKFQGRVSYHDSVEEMLKRIQTDGLSSVFSRWEPQEKIRCNFCLQGISCQLCTQGPCRINEKTGADKGVCGIGPDAMAMRNFLMRNIMGAATYAHHAYEAFRTLKTTGEGKSPYKIKDEAKLKWMCEKVGIDTNQDINKLAINLADLLDKDMKIGPDKTSIMTEAFAPKKRKPVWKKLNIYPSGVDHEIQNAIASCLTNVDGDYVSLATKALRLGLSTIYTAQIGLEMVQDILFGTPMPHEVNVDLGIMDPDYVNIVFNGHQPWVGAITIEKLRNGEYKEEAIKAGAKGIRVVGSIETGQELLQRFEVDDVFVGLMDLLNNRDGLILGICNGFQALIKLGLVPYGEIRDLEEDMPTLTYNNINRHMSSMIRTRISTKKSPWFSEVNLGDIHTVAISHGEGRFVASEELVKKLEENGQIATQYVDFNGNVSLNMPYNPNGSVYGIEGITSPDGRVLGKMGHSERIGENLYKNVPGDFDQKIFKSGVNYFR